MPNPAWINSKHWPKERKIKRDIERDRREKNVIKKVLSFMQCLHLSSYREKEKEEEKVIIIKIKNEEGS